MDKPLAAAERRSLDRHGADVEATRRTAAPIRRVIHGEPAATPERWQAIGESLVRGDEPMLTPGEGQWRRPMSVCIRQTPPQE